MTLNIRDSVYFVGHGSPLVGGLERSFETWASLFTPHGLYISDDTLKAVGSLYLVSPLGEVKYPTHGEICILSWTPHSSQEKDNCIIHYRVSHTMGRLEYISNNT